MAERPPFLAEVRRRVLVEADIGVRAHTCRHIDVDGHPIVVWDQCREHTDDNLFAVCPNCHRRADAGDIDRKPLRIYKARLRSAVIGSEAAANTGEVNPCGVWELVGGRIQIVAVTHARRRPEY